MMMKRSLAIDDIINNDRFPTFVGIVTGKNHENNGGYPLLASTIY